MPTSAQLLAEMKLLHPLLIDLSLGRVERLLGKLGDPHKRLPPCVHVAGTNGQGSVTAFLKAMLEAAGACADRPACRISVGAWDDRYGGPPPRDA